MAGRLLQLDAAHHLAAQPDGSWRMTGSDPQFLVRGPFARGVWEWHLRAAVRADVPAPDVRIYYGANGQFSDAASARFRPFAPDPADRTLRFWLPYDVAVLRFDPADAPGTLVLGEVTAKRHGRFAAAARAFFLQAQRRGLRGVADWVGQLAAAARGGPSSLRGRMVDLLTADESDLTAESIGALVISRSERYHATPEQNLFSLLTTVYDTPPVYLRELAESVQAQSWASYEWVLLDNGSRRSDTRAALAAIARDSRVTLLRSEHNLGILGGMRRVLEQATARYVLPIDSDDYLFPDALATLAAVLQRAGYPPLAYSDEDKLRDGRHVEAFVKPDWDPVLFRNCCYIAHLCAIDRTEALRLGVYTDAAAEGCHDWDTFFRFARAGLIPAHVPEVLYSWRMHGGSTAANVDAKSYVVASQQHVLQQHLHLTSLADRFSVVRSPLFPASPDWWIRRERRTPIAAVALVVDGEFCRQIDYPNLSIIRLDKKESLVRGWQRAAETAPFVVSLDQHLTMASDEWLWEMVGLRESFADAAIVGGRLVDSSRLLVENCRAADDPGYFGTALKQRTVERVDLRLALIDGEWLRHLDAIRFDGLTIEQLAAAFAAQARQDGKRVIASPFIEAQVDGS